MAPIQITRAEYEAKFGGGSQPAAAAPIRISRADYEARFSPTVSAPADDWSFKNELLSVGNKVVDGATGLVDLADAANRNMNPLFPGGPRLFGMWETPQNTPATTPGQDIKDLARSAYLYGDEKAQTMPGRIAGEVAASLPGVAIPGGALATRAASAVGAGLGAGAAKEVTDNPLAELAASLFGGSIPSITNVAQRGVAAIRNRASDTLETSAGALRERALGIQYGDRTKGLNRAAMYVDDSGNLVDDVTAATGVEAPIQQQLEMVKQAGLLDKAPNDPASLKVFLGEQRRAIGTEIRAAADEADKVIGKEELLPDFSEAYKFIASQRGSKREALEKALDEVISDYIAEPGSGIGKLIGFKEKIGREMKFDQLTDQNKTLLMRRIYRDFQSLGEDAFDIALPDRAGGFRDLNKKFEALSNLDRTVNKAVARNAPSLIGTIQGGSKPALALGGAAGMLTGDLGAGVALAGTGLLAKGALELAEQRSPMTMARAYEGLAGRLATEAPDALGKGVAARNAAASLASDLFGGSPSQGSVEPDPRIPPPQRRQEQAPLQKARPESEPSRGTQAAKKEISYDPTDTLAADLFSTADLRGDNVDADTFKQFNSRVVEIADDLGADPADLMAVMRFETGGTLDPKEKNKAGSGATGLIQFMPSTAQSLTGADSREAAIKLMESMSPVEQLDYVKKYLAPFKGRLKTLDDVYMAVLYPKAVGKDSDYALFERGTKAYWQNRGLDIDKDGIVTKQEAASKVRNYSERNNGQVKA